MQNTLTGAVIPEQQLGSVAKLANQMLFLEKQIAALELKRDELAAQYNEISMTKIPNLLLDLGLSEFTLSSGEEVSVKPFYSAKIPDDKKKEAFDWLIKNEHGGIIKCEVACDFAKGDRKTAEAVVKKLWKLGYKDFRMDETVHHSTLKAFAKEMCENAETTANFPRALFGVFEGKKTTIKKP